MATFIDLQNEVKRRATLNQGGTQFDDTVKFAINSALIRLSKEALWRQLRRKSSFDTVTSYSTGSGAGTFTEDSANITVTGATFVTDNIQVGRIIELSGSSKLFRILKVTGETTITLNEAYDGTTTAVGTYEIKPQAEYNLPIQCDHRSFLWHEQWGVPYKLTYLPEQSFFGSSVGEDEEGIPTHYRSWGSDDVVEQLASDSVLTISSSATADTSISITVFGTVSGYPDYETITTNSTDGTTSVNGTKTFTSVERIVKSATSTGRITVTANSTNTTVAVLPVGDTTTSIKYTKIFLYPSPSTAFKMFVHFYKEPFKLVNDGDMHELGEQFDEAIILLAVSKINFQQGKTKEGDAAYLLYKDERSILKKANTDKIDWFPQLLNRTNVNVSTNPHPFLAYSQIGPWFGPRE